jgi:septal ring factor EnvC (AmiA/AmiB activator)
MAKAKSVQGELVVDEIAIRSQFQFDATQIAITQQKITSIAVVDKASFDDAWSIRQDLRGLRVGIDKERKRLTEKARSYTSMVNDVAKSILEHITPVEDAIVAKIDHYETELAERKKAAEIAKQKALQVRIDALMAVGYVPNSFLLGLMSEDEYQTLLAESTKVFEAKKLTEEQERVANELAAKEKAEKEAAERKAADEKRAEELAEIKRVREEQEVERKRLADERAKLAEESRLQKAEADRLKKIEDDRLEAIRKQEEAVEAERQAEIDRQNEAARLQALKPDLEKLYSLSSSLRSVTFPELSGTHLQRFVTRIKHVIESELMAIDMYCEEISNAS